MGAVSAGQPQKDSILENTKNRKKWKVSKNDEICKFVIFGHF